MIRCGLLCQKRTDSRGLGGGADPNPVRIFQIEVQNIEESGKQTLEVLAVRLTRQTEPIER
jgi:hypothetical protein